MKAVAANVAPCGSPSTVIREYGASIGGANTVPPSSAAFAAVASASSVENVTLLERAARVIARDRAIAASRSSNPAAHSS